MSLLLCSTWVYSEPVEIRLVDYFGEYRSDRSLEMELDINNISLAQLSEKVKQLKPAIGQACPGAVAIAYGDSVNIDSFIVNTTVLDSKENIPQLMGKLMPIEQSGGKWYFYFFQKPFHQYLYENKKHHWSSPFNWIIYLGMNTKRIDDLLIHK